MNCFYYDYEIRIEIRIVGTLVQDLLMEVKQVTLRN